MATVGWLVCIPIFLMSRYSYPTVATDSHILLLLARMKLSLPADLDGKDHNNLSTSTDTSSLATEGSLSPKRCSSPSATASTATNSTVASPASSVPSSPLPSYKTILKNVKSGKSYSLLDEPTTPTTTATSSTDTDSAVTQETEESKAARSAKMTAENINGTRVWVKKSAVDAVRNPRLSFKEKMTRKSSVTSSWQGSSLHSSTTSNFVVR